MSAAAAVFEGLRAAGAGIDAVARLADALQGDELAQRIRARSQRENASRDDARRSDRWRHRMLRRAGEDLGDALGRADFGQTLEALLELIDLGFTVDDLVAVAELAARISTLADNHPKPG